MTRKDPTTIDQTSLPPLPSEHINHAALFMQEMNQRMATFDTGITALTSELEGGWEKHEAECKEIADRANQEIADRTDKANARKVDLLNRITDLQLARSMALAALDAKERGT